MVKTLQHSTRQILYVYGSFKSVSAPYLRISACLPDPIFRRHHDDDPASFLGIEEDSTTEGHLRGVRRYHTRCVAITLATYSITDSMSI